MCGFFGILRPRGGFTEADRVHARAALDSLSHRGPDGRGEWCDDHAYLGHRRLKVIDLSDAASQPFIDPDGHWVLVFNGEIYNYLELREELRTLGHGFATDSDTEVLLTALKQWGEGALARLDGMFAFVLYDRLTGRHLLARDPLGQKPLYYAERDGELMFASELGPLLLARRDGWLLDRGAFARFLMAGYHAGAETPVAGLRKLLPGCLLRVEEGRTELHHYWTSRPEIPAAAMDPMAAVEEFDRLFTRSCRRALRSDVPYGVFLSGGIDSSLVLAYCQDSAADVRAFSVAMSERDFDESDKAHRMASHLNVAEHHVFTMDEEAIRAAVQGVLSHMDEPHGDPGYVNSFFLAQSCRPHLTVAVAGDGGDELFAGYAPFAGLRAAGLLAMAPDTAIGLLKGAVGLLPGSDRYLGLQFKARAYLQGFPASEAVRFPLWLASIAPNELGRLLPWLDAPALATDGRVGSLYADVEELMAPLAGASRQQKLLHFYQQRFLPEFVCMHTDRAAMRFGLEVRAPLLSPDLIAFANSLPDSLRVRGGTLKWLLRQAAARRGFPADIVAQGKRGFTFPLARWLKGALRPLMEELLTPAQWEDGLVDEGEMRRLMDGHLAGHTNNYRILYNLMVFRAWRRAYPQVGV